MNPYHFWSVKDLLVLRKTNPRKRKLQQIDYGTFEDSSSIKQAVNIVLKSSSNIDSPKVGPLEKI